MRVLKELDIATTWCLANPRAVTNKGGETSRQRERNGRMGRLEEEERRARGLRFPQF